MQKRRWGFELALSVVGCRAFRAVCKHKHCSGAMLDEDLHFNTANAQVPLGLRGFTVML
jgi:hypothetical protein